MYITQVKYTKSRGEENIWQDCESWFYLYEAQNELKKCKKMYKSRKDYKWRIIERNVIHKVTERVIK